jgi:RNA polymerase sigma-70 factor (ECF subfamily)
MALLAPRGPLDAADAQRVEANRVVEISLTSQKTYDAPFGRVEFDALVTEGDGRQLRVPGFWAGLRREHPCQRYAAEENNRMDPLEDSRATCWTLIQSASAGSEVAREQFAERYLGIVRLYLAHRWHGTDMLSELDDAIQEVFLELFREGGVLDAVRERRPDSFRGFLYGVSRNVARRREEEVARRHRRHPAVAIDPERHEAEEASQSRVFDRAWAQAIFRQAGELQRERAEAADASARNRVRILELRHQENMPIREIAMRWGQEAAVLHKEYAKARVEFKTALLNVLSFHYPGLTDAELQEKCLQLIDLLRG